MLDFRSGDRILALFLVSICLISLYLTIIPTLSMVNQKNFIQSVRLYDYGTPTPTSNFQVSDIVLFSVDVDGANTYLLTIFDETGDVFSKWGTIDASASEILVPLYPPSFHAKRIYGYSLHVCATNFPILGATLSDTESGLFSVGSMKTTLELNATLDSDSHQLSMETALVNNELEPVANQTVGFYLQPNSNDTSLPHRGWVPVGSAKTDNQGKASLNSVCSIGSGTHRVQARFNSNDFENSIADVYFVVESLIASVEFFVERLSSTAKITARLTDQRGFPLSQRLVVFVCADLRANHSVLTDKEGFASLWLNNIPDPLRQVNLDFSVLADRFTSGTELTVNIDLTKSSPAPTAKVEKLEPDKPRPPPHVDPLNLHVNTNDWISLVENNLAVSYITNRSLGDLTFRFYFDAEELLGSVVVEPLGLPPDDYLYSTLFVWTPRETRYLGNHTLYVNATDASDNLIAEGSVEIEVLPCPGAMKLVFPNSFVRETLDLLIAYALPRVYQQPPQSPYVNTYRLAPQFEHDNRTYMIDDVVLSAPVLAEVLVNFESKANLSISGVGLETVPLDMDFESVTWWDVRVNITSGVTTQSQVIQSVTLTNNSIVSADESSEDFIFSSEVLGLDGYNRTNCISEIPVKTSVQLFEEPLMDISVASLMGRQLSKGDSQSFTSDGRKFLRFSLFYDAQSSTGTSHVDVVPDGQISVFDIVAVSNRYGKDLESSEDWTDVNDYDVNGDGQISILDVIAVANQYGKHVDYLSTVSPRDILAKFFYTNETFCSESYLDIEGCVTFPEDAHNVTLYKATGELLVGAKCEEFGNLTEASGATDLSGHFETSFSPEQKGVHLIQTKASSLIKAVHVQFGFDFNSNGTVLFDRLNMLQYLCAVRNPTILSLYHSPENVTGAEYVTAVACLIDESRGEPVSNALVTFELYKTAILGEELVDEGSDYTNSSGIASFSFSSDFYQYTVKAYFSGNNTYFGCSANSTVDCRHSTQMWVRWRYNDDGWGDIVANSSCINLAVGIVYEFYFNVTPSIGGFIGYIDIYVDGEFLQEIQFYDFIYNWTAYSEDTYYFTAQYKGWYQTKPCSWVFLVKAEIEPLMVYFDAAPDRFEPGDVVSLHALAVDVGSNRTFEGGLNFTFLEDGDWNKPIANVTVGIGLQAKASINWTYPADNEVHTVTVSVKLLNGSEVKHMVQPVSLEVCRETKLLFWAEPGGSSNHVFRGRLLTEDEEAVADMPIKVYLNGTLLEEDLTTNGTGYFSFERNFNPGEGKIAYTLQVVFEGAGNQTATLNGIDFMGGSYTVCQTIQFNYKPSANMAIVVVEPQVTDVAVPTKTPEEIQQEAEDGGWVTMWNEWTWWYPWYRLHVQIHVNPTIHIAFNPILPGGELWDWQGLEAFAEIMEEIWQDVMLDFMGVFISYVVAKGLSIWNLVGGLVAEGIKGACQYALFFPDFLQAPSGSPKMLAAGLANMLMGIIAIGTNIGEAFIKALQSMIFGPAISAVMFMATNMISLAAPFRIVRTAVDYVESIVIDFPIAVLALLRWIGRI